MSGFDHGRGDWKDYREQWPEGRGADETRVAHCVHSALDHPCLACGAELEPPEDYLHTDRPLVCDECGAAHTWTAEQGYGDDGSHVRWWVTGPAEVTR